MNSISSHTVVTFCEKSPGLISYEYYRGLIRFVVKAENLHEDRRVAALPTQVVGHCHQEAAEHRKQHRDVMRLPGLLNHTTIFF